MGSRRFIKLLAAASFAVVFASGAKAQSLGVAVSPILVIDTNSVFSSSHMGQQISAELEQSLIDLDAQNKQIKEDLDTEELSLTAMRPNMDADAFRTLADAFDEKVQGIRAAQDAKQRELLLLRENENKTFTNLILPILQSIARERGAMIVLERRNVLLSADHIDITQEAIERLNTALATGDTVKIPNLSPTDN